MVSIMDLGPATQQQPIQQQQIMSQQQQQLVRPADAKPPKSAVSQRSVELQLSPKTNSTEIAKRALKLDLVSATTKDLEEFGIKSPRSPLANSGHRSNAIRDLPTWKKIAAIEAARGRSDLVNFIGLQQFLSPKRRRQSVRSGRLPHQTSLTASVDVEDRKTLRDALYQGIFHRHRRTIFAVGSFLRMLRSRNSQYNTIRSSSEGEDIDDAR